MNVVNLQQQLLLQLQEEVYNMKTSIFPQSIKKETYSAESVAMNLSYFQDQLHLAHWQTVSFSEHVALGELYEYVFSFKDNVVEKIIGYTGKRPQAFKYRPLSNNCNCRQLVLELQTYSDKLGKWADSNGYTDIKNSADELSGKAAKTLYLLTLT